MHLSKNLLFIFYKHRLKRQLELYYMVLSDKSYRNLFCDNYVIFLKFYIISPIKDTMCFNFL